MKKKTLFVLCLMAAAGGFAQSHTFRDTSYVPYEQFDFDAWVMTDPAHNGKKLNLGPIIPGTENSVMGNHDLLQYNYTDDPVGMKVVGISAHVNMYRQRINPYARPEYLLLYEASSDTFELMAEVQWFETDTAGRPEGMYLVNELNCHNPTDDYGLRYMTYANSPQYSWKIYDMYFDKPVIVYDSFYVGGTCHFMSDIFGPELDSCGSMCSYITFVTSNTNNYDTTCFFPSLWKIWDHRIGMSNQWYWAPSSQFLMILPIIEVVDTSFANAPECPRVSGLFARGSFTDTVTVQWGRDSVHRVFEVSYGREGTAPDDGTIVTVYDTRWEFTDTAYRDIPMVSYVRTVCREYDTLRWGEWSSPLRWRLHHEADTGGHGGIGVPEERGDLSRYVRIMPNPASGSVVVMSSYGIERMEVYDMRGERVLEERGRSTTMGFDAASWPRGAYVVVVHTPAGSITKKLVLK